ncbi:MAG: DNA methylase [Treponema sp.]|nr:DNA methylase [Treponema sp.]
MYDHTYIAIDLKSFYASVECRERGLDPLKTNLVVADASRTSKTICLAVTPTLKAYGLSGRSRLFEVEAKAREIKAKTGKDLEYIVAPPHMSLYIQYSSLIYKIYLHYFSPEDIHVYSIDEVFIDATSYLKFYNIDAHTLTLKVIKDVLSQTGITATAGIAPNLYLCKIAMDIVAKHIPADKDGARIAELDEMSYRQKLWAHKPITDFWRVGNGIAGRLSKVGLYTMGDIALQSVKNEQVLYDILGIDAEILIDHAWGYEPVTMKHIKNYKSSQKGISCGQVLSKPYEYEKARIVVREMAELMALDLFNKKLLSSSVFLWICYDKDSLLYDSYEGQLVMDPYGRIMPKPVHGGCGLGTETNSSAVIIHAILKIFDKIVDPNLLIRRINMGANDVIPVEMRQPGLFDEDEEESHKKEDSLQKTRLKIIKRFGKNALLKGMNLQEGATTIERNAQIGGHKA